jgi:hypothetical protein
MNKNPLYVGVDMSKLHFDAAVCPEREPISLGKYANDQSGWKQFVKEATAIAKKHGCQSIHLVVEPTGGYQLPLVSFVFDHGWQVSMPNPKRVRDWGKGMGARAKNDPLDSRILAQFGVACQSEPENQLPEEIASLDSLLRRQEDLQKMLRSEQNRAEALDYKTNAAPAVKESIKRSIAWLGKELAEVEAAIKELLDKHPHLKKKFVCWKLLLALGTRLSYRCWYSSIAGKPVPPGKVRRKGWLPLPGLTHRRIAVWAFAVFSSKTAFDPSLPMLNSALRSRFPLYSNDKIYDWMDVGKKRCERLRLVCW